MKEFPLYLYTIRNNALFNAMTVFLVQDFTNFELIDGGCKDNSDSICDEYSKKRADKSLS